MPFQISTMPGGQSFAARSEQTILDAALEAGLLLPYGCRDGACGACKAEIASGRIDPGTISGSALTPEERVSGQALLCQARALSDLTLKVRTPVRSADIPVRKMPCRVHSLERAASDVMVLKLRLPARQDFTFRPGQYIDFLLDGGRRRSFSIASSPSQKDFLELHVRRIDGGLFTPRLFEQMQAKDILRFEGPLGSFGLQPDSPRPIVLLAGGTGFAPIKSIIEALIDSGGSDREILLYWGARRREGLYMNGLARSWEQRLTHFHYLPVLSEPETGDNWSGRTGLVHHALISDLPDLSNHEVYACGSPQMVDTARAELTAECSLSPEAFFADAFTFAADPPAAVT